MASQLTFRPQDEEDLFGVRDDKPWLRSRLVNICNDTREVRKQSIRYYLMYIYYYVDDI
eukprot:COSAG06_NODE_51647_length_310_cov_6.251185_1_plen_58_part_10